ncbi:MAG: PH domain-containing protein [Acidimicrobiales bacterium]
MVRSPFVDRTLVVGAPAVLAMLGAYGVWRGGVATPGMALLVAGVAVFVAAAWTIPLGSSLGPDGVEVRTLVRRRHVGWDDVVAFERHRGKSKGALVVRTVEPARIALSTSVERFDVHNELRDLVRHHGASIALPEPPPVWGDEKPL